MKYIGIILASILCAQVPMNALQSQEEQGSSVVYAIRLNKLGKEKVADVRKAYLQGEYRQFLRQMDESYKKADLSTLTEMRQKNVPVDFQLQWEERFAKLQQERNKELLKTLDQNDNSELAQQVRSMAEVLGSEAQEKAISKLNSFIATAPNTGANADENALIAIDLEYEYKLFNASMPSDEFSPEQIEEHQLALRMEKMDRMLEASKSFTDHSLKTAVGLAASSLDARLARNIDGIELNKKVKAGAVASDEKEEKIFSVMAHYQGKFSDLLKEIDQASKQ